jgi:SAM-dependent methyltransferase
MNSPAVNVDTIRSFWDDRARQFGADGRATLRETHLREVEVRTMMRKLRDLRPGSALDVGCGNGWSTKQYARRFPGTEFVGVDFSGEMIRHARDAAPPNCRFMQADVLDAASLPRGPFDVVMTQRCIQNVPGWETQKRAIRNLMAVRSRRGVLLLMECSKDGVAQLNGLRTFLGLPAIDGIEPWHNTFLRDRLMIDEFGTAVECFASTYMFLAKVVHKRLSYVARYLPALGRFGYDRLYIIR